MNKQYEKGQISTMVIIAAIVALVIGGVLGWTFKSSRVATTNTQIAQTSSVGIKSQAENELHNNMRRLWEDHITWTRMYLVSAAYDNNDTEEVAARLLKNQEDIGNAIKPYYGEEAGNKLTTLLKSHITLATEVVSAAKRKDAVALADANKKWYDNANEIADFLSSANPNWPKDVARNMMKEHLDLTLQEAVDILAGRNEAGITDYDNVHNQILKMADMLTDGIVKQFPDKFK